MIIKEIMFLGKGAWDGGVGRRRRGSDMDAVLMDEVLKTIKLPFRKGRRKELMNWGGENASAFHVLMMHKGEGENGLLWRDRSGGQLLNNSQSLPQSLKSHD